MSDNLELHTAHILGVERLAIYLCPLFQSHWDRLPLELQQYILSLSTWQHIRDRRRIKSLCELLEEINDYGEIKQMWTISPIKVCLKRYFYDGKYHYSTEVFGRRLKASIKYGEYQRLGYSVRFAKYNASAHQIDHLCLIEEHPEWFLD